MVAWWSWSLRQRLAVAICGTLAVGIIAFGFVAWNEVRASAVMAAEARLETVTRRIADLLATSVAQQKSQVIGVARDRGLQLIAAGGTGADRDSAVSRIQRTDSASAPILAIDIWKSDGTVLFSTAPDSTRLDDTARRDILATISPTDSAAVGPFRIDGDTIRYPSLAPVRGAPARTW